MAFFEDRHYVSAPTQWSEDTYVEASLFVKCNGLALKASAKAWLRLLGCWDISRWHQELDANLDGGVGHQMARPIICHRYRQVCTMNARRRSTLSWSTAISATFEQVQRMLKTMTERSSVLSVQFALSGLRSITRDLMLVVAAIGRFILLPASCVSARLNGYLPEYKSY
jgi:hypothetical protein